MSLLIALITSAALPPTFVADGLPRPAASSHGAPHKTLGNGAHAGLDGVRRHAPPGPGLVNRFVEASSSDSIPTNRIPFHGMWMTRDRPPMPARPLPAPGGSVFPTSFAAAEFPPRALAAAANQHARNQYCVTRC
jgi:hypothetical protein